jgi:O-antigen ligase
LTPQRAIDIRWLYATIAVYIGRAVAGLIAEFYWILLLPAALLLAYAALFKLDKLFLFTAFCTPLAINLSKTELGIGVSLPTEPLFFIMMVLYLLNSFYEGRYDAKLFRHPVTILILAHLGWMLITSCTSSLFMVSIKRFVSQLWFIALFYFLAVEIFKNKKNIYHFVWLYVIGMVITMIYTLSNHAINDWTEQSAHWVMVPFYNDHTAYAAVLALFLPVLITLSFNKEASTMNRFFALLISILTIVAIVFSYTRAAWLGIAVAVVSLLVFIFRVRTWVVLCGIAGVIIAYFVFQSTVLYKFEKTKEYSSTDYRDHLKSITNIKTDASNVERLNRWSCAWRMFKDKPIFGWGPGTFQFQYGSYQLEREKSYISTNAGDKGNAHSEYLGPLCEEGLLGMLIFVALSTCAIYRGSRVVVNSKSIHEKLLAGSLLLGLITYWIHGFLNNFLDTDKASVPFWGFIAALVVMDISSEKEEKKLLTQTP